MNSSSRNGAKVLWLCLHSTEGIMRAVDLRAWEAWQGSSHASNDETGVLLSGSADGFVDYSRAAWTLRNANPYSDNLEQCAWARWTREEWLARPKLLDTTAKWLADRHKAQPWIPLRRLTPAEIRAKVPGVLGHGDYSAATGDGTHTDPGPGYPWDVVLTKARGYAAGTDPGGFLMALTDSEQREVLDLARYLKKNGEGDRFIHEIPARVAGLVGGVDVEKLAAALAPKLSGVPRDELTAAVREVFADAGQG